MKKQPKSVLAANLLILLEAIFWLGFAVAAAAGMIPSITAGVVRWIMAVLALGCSAALAGLAFLLWKRSRRAFYFSVILMGIVAILSIADQFGLLDLLSFLVNLVALILLLKDRAWYLGAGGKEP
jgi:predicted membrane channel-forming protein YqfA (hemolysin III family)